MKKLSAVDIGLAGFRFVRAKPAVVAVWGAVYLAFSLLVGATATAMIDPALFDLTQASAGRDTVSPMAGLRRAAPGYAVFCILSLSFYAATYAAMARAVLQPDRRSVGYLAFGGDELRQALLMLQGLLVVALSYLTAAILAVIVAAAASRLTDGGSAAAVIAFIAIFVGAAAFAVVLLVRLSLASPLTFDRRRVDLFGSWKLTRGVFWPLLGGYALALLLTAAVALLFLIILAALAVVADGGMQGVAGLLHPDMSSMEGYFAPFQLILLVVGAVWAALIFPMMVMPSITAYAQLTRREDDIWD